MHCPCEPERCRREMVLWAEGWAGRTLHGNSPSYNSTHPSRQRGRWPTQSHPVLGNDTGMGSALLVAGFQSGMNGKPWHRRSKKQHAPSLHFFIQAGGEANPKQREKHPWVPHLPLISILLGLFPMCQAREVQGSEEVGWMEQELWGSFAPFPLAMATQSLSPCPAANSTLSPA